MWPPKCEKNTILNTLQGGQRGFPSIKAQHIIEIKDKQLNIPETDFVLGLKV